VLGKSKPPGIGDS